MESEGCEYGDELPNILSGEQMDKIFDEFRLICKEDKNKTKIDENSIIPVNLEKNRYPDVLPLKDTAVKLDEIEGVEGSDYINANFVRDLSNTDSKKQLYICCQAPLSSTVGDFWRMVWSYNASVIVMITNLVEKNRIKADPYWPENVGQIEKFGQLCVKLMKEEKRSPSVTLRYLKIWKSESNGESKSIETSSSSGDLSIDEENDATPEDSFSTESSQGEEEPIDEQGVRNVIQLHCTEWPDNGVPTSTQIMKDLIKEVNMRTGYDLDKPIVVHCSAGIGRTGTFVAIHMSLQKDLHGEHINIKDTVLHLRSQRLGMVQSKEQYMFVYAVTADILRERREMVAARQPCRNKSKNNGRAKLYRNFTLATKKIKNEGESSAEEVPVTERSLSVKEKRRIKSDRKMKSNRQQQQQQKNETKTDLGATL